MTYTKFHDPWNSGTCCGTPNPGPDTPLTVGAANAWEQALFDAHNIEAATAATEQQSARVVGDTDPRYQQLADGTINWGDGSGATDVSLFRQSPNWLATSGVFGALIHVSTQGTANDISYTANVVGDPQWRYQVLADGTIAWGSGAVAPDVTLFRSGANTLRTTGDFSIFRTGAAGAELRLSADAGQLDRILFRTGSLNRWGIQKDATSEVGGNAGSNMTVARYDDAGNIIGTTVMTFNRATGVVAIQVPGTANGAIVSVDGTQTLTNKTYAGFGATATTPNMNLRVTGDTQVRWAIDVSGKMQWSPGSGALDTTLQRSAAGVLQATDTQLQSTRSLTTLAAHSALVNGDTQVRWQVLAGGTQQWGPGNAAVDTNLFRNGVDQLKTDDKFLAALGIGVGNTAAATTLGAVTRRMELFDAAGVSLGFVPVYNSIT